MFRLIKDVSSYRSDLSGWIEGNCSAESGHIAPDGSFTAYKLTVNSTGNLWFFHDSVTLVDSLYRYGIWMWTDSGQPFGGHSLGLEVQSPFYRVAKTFSLSNVPRLFQLSANSMVGVDLRWTVNPTSTLSAYLYVWQPHVAAQRQYLDIEPTNFADEGEKIINRHRTRAGDEYRYTWGSFERFDLPVEFVNSSFRHTVNNSFWPANADLLFINTPGSIVKEVHIVNKRRPIGRYIEPLTDHFRGTIELETY